MFRARIVKILAANRIAKICGAKTNTKSILKSLSFFVYLPKKKVVFGKKISEHPSMTIANGKVVGIHYHLKNDKGETIDKSSSPLEYLHGSNNIIHGLEKELEGLKVGDAKTVGVSPKDGYGEYDSKLVFEVPVSQFGPNPDIQVGMQVEADSEKGVMILYVQEVLGEKVVLNGNHPLAGEVLHFAVDVASIREATSEEISHGHAHGPGGHHHH